MWLRRSINASAAAHAVSPALEVFAAKAGEATRTAVPACDSRVPIARAINTPAGMRAHGSLLFACFSALLLSACGSMPFGRSKGSTAPSTTSAPAPAEQTSSSGGATTTPLPEEDAQPAPSASAESEKKSSRFGGLFRRDKKPDPAPAAPLPGAPGAAEVIPPQARADFERAVGLMRAGNDGAAQVAFQQLATDYPQFTGARINLGILHRKAGRLEQSETALVEALARNRDNAIAWNELGVTQRMKGEFQMAQDSYENAIRADPDYAPAYRNLGVLLDLYMGDANGALDNLERYKELTNEDKPVTGWIAELRQRTGRKAPRPPAPEPAEEAPAAVGAGNGESSDGTGTGGNGADGNGGSAPADGSSNDGNATDGASGEGAPAESAPPAEPQRAGL
jgi:hypothetical protein